MPLIYHDFCHPIQEYSGEESMILIVFIADCLKGGIHLRFSPKAVAKSVKIFDTLNLTGLSNHTDQAGFTTIGVY